MIKTTPLNTRVRGRTCSEKGCRQPAAAIYKKKPLCDGHLNPEMPKPDVSEVVLVRSNWAPFDEQETIKHGEAYNAKSGGRGRRKR